ncbi:MAG: S9 family peptidase [Pseudomonadota bacterium]
MLTRCLLSALLLTSPLVGITTPVSLDDFVRPAEYRSLRISPDGSYLAALIPAGNQNALVVIDRQKMAVMSSIRMDLGQQVGQLYWASNDRVLAKILSRQSDNDRVADFGELFAMDADGGRRKLVFGYRVGEMGTGSKIRKADGERAWGGVLHPLPDDKKHALIISYPFANQMAAIPTVYQLNIINGTKRAVTRLPVPQARAVTNAKMSHWASFGTDPEGRAVLHVRGKKSADWRLLMQAESLEQHLRAVSVSEDGSGVLALTNVGFDTISLVRIDMESGAVEPVIADPNYDAGRVVMGSDQFTVLGVCFEAAMPKCTYLDPDHPESQALSKVQAAFTEQFMTVASWTRGGEEAVLWVTADRNPGDYFMLQTNKLKVDYLLSSRRWLEPNDLAPMQPITFAARDGQEIEGYLTRPVGALGPLPTVVQVHGGPHGPRDNWRYQPEVQMLANRGFQVLQVNYRGSGGYGLAFERAGHRRWGTAIQNDITDGVRWGIEQALVDPQRVCISGGSFGGYSALMSVAREPDLYKCAVGHVGVYDMALMFRSGDIPDVRGGVEYLKLALGTDPELHYQQSPVNHVAAIKAALMISYGKRDERAPPIQSTRLVEALTEADRPFSLVVERREGHGFVNPATRRDFFQAKLDFFNRHIGPAVATEVAAP